MVNFSSLTAEVGWSSLGHPSKFQRVSCLGFVTAPTSLRRSLEANQTLHDVWPSPRPIHCTSSGALAADGILPGAVCQVQNSLCVQVLHSPIFAALLHGTPAAGSAGICGMLQGMELPKGITEGATYIRLSGDNVGHRPLVAHCVSLSDLCPKPNQ